MRRKPFWKIFLERAAIAVVLVFITYNIWGLSYYHWVASNPFEGFAELGGALKILAGILLCVSYLILVWATWRAKGPIGILLLFIVLGAFVYVAWAAGLIDLGNPNEGTLVAQAVVVLGLAIGSTWSIFWKRMSGQVATEDPDTE